jgi:hypothetical protein
MYQSIHENKNLLIIYLFQFIFLVEFVMCQHCKSSNTVLTKYIDARLYTKECKNCKATMSVSTLRLVNKKKDRWKKK